MNAFNIKISDTFFKKCMFLLFCLFPSSLSSFLPFSLLSLLSLCSGFFFLSSLSLFLPSSSSSFSFSANQKKVASPSPASPTAPSPPQHWLGQIWARTGCSHSNNRFSCLTGDCGGKLECNGAGGSTPATLAQLVLHHGPNDLWSYGVSLVDGYNVPMNKDLHSKASLHLSAFLFVFQWKWREGKYTEKLEKEKKEKEKASTGVKRSWSSLALTCN